MPYIVETRTDRLVDDVDQSIIMYRRAVATLDDTKEIVEKKIREEWGYFGKSIKSPPDHLRDLREMTDQGGTIGPLPDGTSIVVEKVSWDDLTERSGLGVWRSTARSARGNVLANHERSGTRHTRDEIIDAFNAVHHEGNVSG